MYIVTKMMLHCKKILLVLHSLYAKFDFYAFFKQLFFSLDFRVKYDQGMFLTGFMQNFVPLDSKENIIWLQGEYLPCSVI